MNYQEFLAIKNSRRLKPVGHSYIDRALRQIASLWDSAIFGGRAEVKTPCRRRTSFRLMLTLIFLVIISFVTTLEMLGVCATVTGACIITAILRKRFRLQDFLGGFGVAALFTLIVALPATLNLFAHGDSQVILPLLSFSSAHHFGPWTIPTTIGITQVGLYSAATLLLRALTSVSALLWLTLTTRWVDLLRALRSLGIPALMVQIFAMTLIYMHLLLKRAEEVHMARKSRMMCKESTLIGQRWVGTRIACAWEDSIRLMDDVHHSMIARGFTGEVNNARK